MLRRVIFMGQLGCAPSVVDLLARGVIPRCHAEALRARWNELQSSVKLDHRFDDGPWLKSGEGLCDDLSVRRRDLQVERAHPHPIAVGERAVGRALKTLDRY